VKVLVTGAFGYLGLALVRGLGEAHRIVALGRPPRRPGVHVQAGVETVHGDVLEHGPHLVESGEFEAIVHVAGGGGLHKCEADPTAAVRDNVEATLVLAAAARRARVPRLLFASTIAVYGTHRQPSGPYREDDTPCPDELYGALKRAAETAWTAPELGGGTALRIANVYGAGAGVDVGVSGAVERFARAAATGGEITVFGSGAQRIDYVHVDDVVRAFALALAAPVLPSVLNVGGGSPVSIRELAAVCVGLGESRRTAPRIIERPAPEGKLWPDRRLAIDRARETLGWSPQVPLARGLGDLVDMMARAGVSE
jgi:UDP-glucose 4-epimerase